jgi:Ca2+-dependent lipid-binding protein
MDPFVELQLNGKSIFHSKPCKNGGKHPVWNENVDVHLDTLLEELKLICYDEDWLKNDNIGECVVAINTICDLNGIKKWVPIFYKGQKAGEILLFGKYTPPLNFSDLK